LAKNRNFTNNDRFGQSRARASQKVFLLSGRNLPILIDAAQPLTTAQKPTLSCGLLDGSFGEEWRASLNISQKGEQEWQGYNRNR
jgi:hypothetical protein